MAIRPALPRQVWVVLFALGLAGALAWVATQSGLWRVVPPEWTA